MTRDPIHPGETLREDLEEIGMSAAELAWRIKVPVNHIAEVLNGHCAITGDKALRLGASSGRRESLGSIFKRFTNCVSRSKKNGAEIVHLPSLGNDNRLHTSS